MTTIGWLHVGDLHHALRRPGLRAPEARRALLADLQAQHRETGPWHLVIVAGDLGWEGSAEEIEDAAAQLDEILAFVPAAQGDVKPVLLAVPGNHDLRRATGPAAAYEAIRRFHASRAVRDEVWDDVDSPARRLIDRALAPFEGWWRKRASGVPGLRHGLLPGDFTVTIEVDGIRLGVAGLCSTFLQVTGDDDEGRLSLSPHQLTVAAGGDPAAWAARHDVALLVTHHAPSWLSREDVACYEAEINPHGRFAAHLCAHAHDEDPFIQAGERPLIRCPSLFGLASFEGRRGEAIPRRHGYVAARLTLSDGAGEISIWPRIWADGAFRAAPEAEEAGGSVSMPVRRVQPPEQPGAGGEGEARGAGRTGEGLFDVLAGLAPAQVQAVAGLMGIGADRPISAPALFAAAEREGGSGAAALRRALGQVTSGGGRPAVRRTPAPEAMAWLLDAAFSDDRDLEAFVMDHQPALYRTFMAGVGRARRIRALLGAVDRAALLDQLRRARPEVFAARRREMEYAEDELRASDRSPLGSSRSKWRNQRR